MVADGEDVGREGFGAARAEFEGRDDEEGAVLCFFFFRPETKIRSEAQ